MTQAASTAYSTYARLVRALLEQADTWPWDDERLAELAQVLEEIDHAEPANDAARMQAAYLRLATLGTADPDSFRYGSRARKTTETAPSPRFPRQRTNELVHRLTPPADQRRPSNEDASGD